ncbi:MAG: type I glyceraldehyde-3-phosphate dehydrogenase [Patescibacteria group bacterium]|jgi:glyceraldehyde 3-phosphate dehydrogenase
MVKIAINGFGRIGKAAFKVAIKRNDVEVVAINGLSSVQDSAHLFKYDSVYGTYEGTVSTEGEDILVVDGKKYKKLAVREPKDLPWKELGVDIVLECTGLFTKKEKAKAHLDAGAKRVIISAPSKGDDPVGTYVLGVNQDEMDHESEQIISNASCTTNCIAPVMKVMQEVFGVKKAMMTTIHAYTADQNLVDGSHKSGDMRRARASALNIVPTSTGAARAVGKTIKHFKGIFDGLAIRVPVPCGSLSDIVFITEKETTKEEVNAALKKASEQPKYKGILTVTDEPIVSSDVVGNPASNIVDLALTNVVGGDLVKVIAWYDNEWGYSNRLVEQAVELAKYIK